MITNFETTNVLNAQIMGLSTDTKPTTGVQPNSLFWELDTNGMYFFDGTQWQPIGGSGGGGGESDFSTAQVTVVAGSQSNNANVISRVVLIQDDELIVSMLQPDNPRTVTAVLYKGKQFLEAANRDNVESVSGNIEYDETYSCYVITGDCSITMYRIPLSPA